MQKNIVQMFWVYIFYCFNCIYWVFENLLLKRFVNFVEILLVV